MTPPGWEMLLTLESTDPTLPISRPGTAGSRRSTLSITDALTRHNSPVDGCIASALSLSFPNIAVNRQWG